MARIKAPKIPVNEDATVTISNQERQINMLLSRVEQLTEQNVELELNLQGQREMVSSLSGEISSLQDVVARMEGWRDCAREIIGSMELPLTSALP